MMNWEQRLREMVFAGGAVAALGCSDTGASPSVDSDTGLPGHCCNANADPCCAYLGCGAPLTPACASQLEGGGPDHSVPESAATGDSSDARSQAPDIGADAVSDGTDASSEASSDAPTYDVFSLFCCNANPDPCCRSLYCGDPMTPACACKSDGGTWSYSAMTDGGSSCSYSREAGLSDAGSDGDARD